MRTHTHTHTHTHTLSQIRTQAQKRACGSAAAGAACQAGNTVYSLACLIARVTASNFLQRPGLGFRVSGLWVICKHGQEQARVRHGASKHNQSTTRSNRLKHQLGMSSSLTRPVKLNHSSGTVASSSHAGKWRWRLVLSAFFQAPTGTELSAHLPAALWHHHIGISALGLGSCDQ